MVRAIDQLDARPLVGIDNAVGPFFSPDSQWIGFFEGDAQLRELKKVSITGGPAVTLCRIIGVGMPLGASWGDDNMIVFATNDPGTGLWQVSDDKLHALATAEDTDARVLMAAIGVLLERGFGKPPQAIEHSGTIDSQQIDTDLFSDQELHFMILLTRKGLGQPVPELTAVRDLLERFSAYTPYVTPDRPQ